MDCYSRRAEELRPSPTKLGLHNLSGVVLAAAWERGTVDKEELAGEFLAPLTSPQVILLLQILKYNSFCLDFFNAGFIRLLRIRLQRTRIILPYPKPDRSLKSKKKMKLAGRPVCNLSPGPAVYKMRGENIAIQTEKNMVLNPNKMCEFRIQIQFSPVGRSVFHIIFFITYLLPVLISDLQQGPDTFMIDFAYIN